MSARTTKLPPNKAEVEGCKSCPLCATSHLDESAYSECQHPQAQGRTVADGEPPTEPPDFCPLIRAPLLLQLAKEEL